MSDLRERVRANLEAALANDHDFTNYDSLEVAVDMVAYAEDCEGEDPREIQTHVEEWQRERRTVQ